MNLTWSSFSSRRRDRTQVRRKTQHHRRVMALESLEDRALLSTFTWNGSASSDWSVSGNWTVTGPVDLDGLPDSGDDVVFSGTPTNNSVVNQTFTVRSVTLDGTFTGSVSLGADLTSLGATAQAGFTQSGGTFNVNSYTLTSGNAFTVAGSTFNPGTGTVTFNTPINSGPGPISAASVNFNNVNINYGSHHVNVTAGLHVNGDLTINGAQQLTGRIYANGNVTTTMAGMFSNPVDNGYGLSRIIIGGSGNTTLSTGSSPIGSLPDVEIKRTGGTLTILGNINIGKDWTHISGNVNAAASTIKFWTGSSHVDTNTMAFGNVTIDAGSHHFYVKKMKVGGDLLIANIQDLLYDTGAGSGALTVYGDLTSTDAAVAGPVDISMLGSDDATITGGDFPNGGIIINKAWDATINANVTTPLDGTLSLVKFLGLTGSFAVGKNVVGSYSSQANFGGKLVFAGTGNQTLSTTADNVQVPGIEINKPSGTLTLNPAHTIGVVGNWDYVQGTVVTTGSKVKFPHGWQGASVTVNVDNGPYAFNDVELALGYADTLNGQPMDVNGTLTISKVGFIQGTINAGGDVITSYHYIGGNGEVVFNGTTDQTLSATADGMAVPSVKVSKPSGKLILDPTYIIGVNGNWTNTNNTVVTVTGSTIAFQNPYYSSPTATFTVDNGTSPFNNVNINLTGTQTLAAANLNVNGALTIQKVGYINAATGAITVAGNLTSLYTAVGGTADITMVGAGNATLTGGDFPNGGIIINKTVGSSVSLGSNLAGVSKLAVDSGTLDFGTYTMAVVGQASVAAAGTLAFTATPSVTQLTVNGNLTFAAGSKINVTPGGSFPQYTLIAVTGGNSLTDGGVVITGVASSSVTTGVNGTVKITN